MRTLIFVLALLPMVSLAAEPAKIRFELHYGMSVLDLEPGQEVAIWLPIPPNNEEQSVKVMSKLFPGPFRETVESAHGNRMFYSKTKVRKEGKLAITVEYDITRNEVQGAKPGPMKEKLDLYLKPDRLAPADGKHLQLLKELKLPEKPMEIGKSFYDLVNTRLKYSKEGTEWGRGDVNWVCDSRFGNCTDFHSLFIALCRSQKIPAKFEIGLSVPEDQSEGKINGYHCWAKFRPDNQGWVPVDISEANKNPKQRDYYFGNLNCHRVLFSTGRDLVLEPKQAGEPLNYFVFPYVEIDGKPATNARIFREIRFRKID